MLFQPAFQGARFGAHIFVHLAGGAALDEDEVVVSDAFVHHLLGRAHEAGIEGLLAFIRGHGEKHLPWAIHGPSVGSMA